jgi:hypothetical protein
MLRTMVMTRIGGCTSVKFWLVCLVSALLSSYSLVLVSLFSVCLLMCCNYFIFYCDVDGIRQDQSIEDNSNENDPAQPSSEKDGAPTLRASRHLFLQTIRALLRFIPSHFQNHIDTVIGQLLEVRFKCVSVYLLFHVTENLP